MFLHPLTAPRRGIEKGHHAKRPGRGVPQPAPHGLAFRELRRARVVRVENKIPLRDEWAFPAVADTPIDKKRALVLQTRGEGAVLDAEIADFVSAKTHLRFPAREIRINEEVAVGDQARAAADDKHEAALNGINVFASRRNPRAIEKRRQFQPGKKSKNRIVAA